VESDPPLASVVIPTFNRARRLELTLASFVGQTDRRHEVVVVDDGSTDDTPEVLARYAGRIRLKVVRQANGGRSAARNAGVREAAGAVLIFCDDDRIAVPGFVADHLSGFPDGDEPRVVLGRQHAVVSRLEPDLAVSPEELAAVLDRRPELAREARQGDGALIHPNMVLEDFAATMRDFGVTEPFWRDFIQPVVDVYGDGLEGFEIPWTIGVTGNLSVPRRRVLDVGAFDESFKGWGLEDTDLCLRLHAAGARFRLHSGACNYHQVHERPEERLDDWCRSLVYFLDKHDALEVWAFVCGLFERRSLGAISELIRQHREAGPSDFTRELELVTREHARLLARTALL
jgi:glycosyltransferase involved in cell wall biosynthesis